MVAPNVLHLNGTHVNSPAQTVVLNGQTQFVINQPNAINNRIPNSPFQSYTVKKEPAAVERVENNEVIVLDDEDECVIMDQGMEEGNDDGDIIEVLDGKFFSVGFLDPKKSYIAPNLNLT
jgi:hypothetical protein